MDPQQQIERLLSEDGATLLRNTKHPVYKLSNGKTVTLSSTPSDHRSSANTLSDLRKALGKTNTESKIAVEKPRTFKEQLEEAKDIMASLRDRVVELEAENQTLVLQVNELLKESLRSSLPPALPDQSPTERLLSLIVSQERERDRCLKDAEAYDGRIRILKALEPLATDPGFELILTNILPPPPPPVSAKPEAPPAPPQSVSRCIHVTRDLVHLATQTFDNEFTVNDVLEVMLNGQTINKEERTRVRQTIAQMMISLHERGQVMKQAQGVGRIQSTWRKVDVTQNQAS